MNYFSTTINLLILMFVLICCVEASPIRTVPAERTKRFSCPDIRLICPTEKKHFTVRSSWSWRSLGCKLDGSIVDIALKECNNTIMDLCKDKWLKKHNNCSVPVPILKEILDSVFHGACFLHDLCYLSLKTNRKDCDDWFHHNMKQICSIRKLTRPLCVGSAYAMYLAVRGFGRPYFTNGQKWAIKHCIPENPEDYSGFIIDGSGSGSGKFGFKIDLESGSGSAVQPEEQSPEQNEPMQPSNKPEKIEPSQSDKQS